MLRVSHTPGIHHRRSVIFSPPHLDSSQVHPLSVSAILGGDTGFAAPDIGPLLAFFRTFQYSRPDSYPAFGGLLSLWSARVSCPTPNVGFSVCERLRKRFSSHVELPTNGGSIHDALQSEHSHCNTLQIAPDRTITSTGHLCEA